MKKKQAIKEFKEEFLLSDDYEYTFAQDDGGKSLDVLVPEEHGKYLRMKLPRKWRGLRILIISRKKRLDYDEDDDEI